MTLFIKRPTKIPAPKAASILTTSIAIGFILVLFTIEVSTQSSAPNDSSCYAKKQNGYTSISLVIQSGNELGKEVRQGNQQNRNQDHDC
jgi:hypothetical protein